MMQFIDGIYVLLGLICMWFVCSDAGTTAPPRAAFTAHPQHVIALLGESHVVFDCTTQGTRNPVIWKVNEKTVGYGAALYVSNAKYSVEVNGNINRFIVHNLTFADEGEYGCEIVGEGAQLTNTLTVNEPASVQMLGYQDIAEVELGESLELTCHVEGKPTPQVIWRRIGDDLPSGEAIHTGETLHIHRARSTDSGVYECSATNDAGPPASETLEVVVKFAPYLSSQNSLLHVGPGTEVNLTCVFHASPRVVVTWIHNGSTIDFALRRNLRQSEIESGRYGEVTAILSLLGVRGVDLGHYMCRGENARGSVEGQLRVSALPYNVEIISDPQGPYSNEYRLQWEVMSTSLLVEFHLRYEMGETLEEDSEIVATFPVQAGHDMPHSSHHHLFKDLPANSTYAVQLQARNLFGESEWSDVFVFHTAEDGKTAPPVVLEPTTTKTTLSHNPSGGSSALHYQDALLLVMALCWMNIYV